MITETIREYVLAECNSDKDALGRAFFDQHLTVVVGYAKSLAGVLGADLEIVELAGWLHDIAAVRDIATLPKHPVLGAGIARSVLGQNSYPSDRIDRVARCILAHSVPVQIGRGMPEEVCLSNADAMSQITKPAYWLYFVFRIRQLGYDEGKAWLLRRVESNWAALVQPARDIIEKDYRRAKEVLDS